MGILGYRQVAQIGEGIVDGYNIFNAHPHPEIDLQSGFLLPVEIGFALEIADTGTQRHNFLIIELHSEMRIHINDLALYQRITFSIEGAIKTLGKRPVEPFPEMDCLAAAQQQCRNG